MFALKRLMPAVAVLGAVSLTACSDSTSPDSVDAQALQGSLSAATATFQNNAAFQSIYILSSQFPQFAAITMLRGTMPAPFGAKDPRALLSSRVGAARLAASIVANPQALFPANLLGKTLEWSVAGDSFAVGGATGAPANGVRVLLYLANPSTGRPVPGLAVLGYLDLTDKSTPQADVLGVLVRLAATTIAEYDIHVVRGTTTANFRANGYMRDGTATQRVDFDLVDDVDIQASTLTSSNDLTGNDGASIHVELAIGVASDALTTTIARNHNSLELSAAGNLLGASGPLTGTVKFNTALVANLGGTVLSPTITGTNNHTLQPLETLALITIFQTATDIAFAVSDGVFAPGVIVFSH